MMPVDLSVPGGMPIQASRWAVIWWVDDVRHERYCDDRALAEAYAAAHREFVLSLLVTGLREHLAAARGLGAYR